MSGTSRQFGPAYDRAHDGERVDTQMLRVRDFLLESGEWLTLSEICAGLEVQWECRFPESSISAQLRHLRKKQFGGYHVDKRRRGGPGQGLFEYRLSAPDADATDWYERATGKARPSVANPKESSLFDMERARR